MSRAAISAELPEHPATRLARVGPAGMELQVRTGAVRYGVRAAVPLLIILVVIFGGIGALVVAAESDWVPLVAFLTAAVAIYVPVALFMAVRSRGLMLAADADGVWLRPHLDRTRAAWLPWHAIGSIDVRRFLGTAYLCVTARDPAYAVQFSRAEHGGGETGTGMRIGHSWQLARLRTGLAVPVSHAVPPAAQIVATLRRLADGRCPIS